MRMKTKIWMRLLGSVLLAALTVVPAPSQDKPADNMQLVREKLKADKKLLVADNMKLTETEAKSFWPVYDSYQKDLGALVTRTVKLIQDYASSYTTMTNEIARKLVDESMAIESDRNKLRQTYLPKFRQTLPEIKVARYYQIENKIQAAVNYDLAAGIPLAQ
jgi:hypothetical protein